MMIPNTSESSASSDAARANRDWIILALLLAFASTGFVQKYTGLPGVAVYVACIITALFLIGRFSAGIAPWCRRHFRGLTVMLLVGLAACFAVLHPIEDRRGLGKSSDRDEGLDLAVTRMAEGKYPYYPSDKFAGPLSVLPGSIVLAAPFVALGTSAYQNLFWLAAFLLMVRRVFRDAALALCLLTVPLALSPAVQYEYISGGDMLANGIFVTVFFLLALESWSNPDASNSRRWLTCVLLGVGLASRSNFLLLLPLFGAVLWRQVGLRQAIAGSGLVALAAAAIIVPFYLHDPGGFTPLLAKQKLAIVDHALPWASKTIIGMTALAGLLGALALLRHPAADLHRAFFRWCALVTLCPMFCAVSLSSLINGHPDFGFMCDRFGLMYVFFALLGWGGRMLGGAPAKPVSVENHPIT